VTLSFVAYYYILLTLKGRLNWYPLMKVTSMARVKYVLGLMFLKSKITLVILQLHFVIYLFSFLQDLCYFGSFVIYLFTTFMLFWFIFVRIFKYQI